MNTVIISCPKIVLISQEGVHTVWLRSHPGCVAEEETCGARAHMTLSAAGEAGGSGWSLQDCAWGLWTPCNGSFSSLCTGAPNSLNSYREEKAPSSLEDAPPCVPVHSGLWHCLRWRCIRASKEERFSESLLWLLRNRRQEQS